MTKTLLLLILLLAGFMAFIPHIGYAFPLHADEWTHLTYAKTVASTGSITFPDPFREEGPVGLPGDNVALGFYILWAIVQQISGIDWLLLWHFGPSVIFMLTVLCVYIFANKQGYGLEAAFFTCLIPTTGGLLGPAFMVPMALGLFFIPLSLYIAFNVKSWPSYLLLFLIACFLWLMHPTTAAIQGIVLLPFILISIINSRGRGLGLLAALFLPVLISLPFTINQLLPAAGQLLTPKGVFPPPFLDLPAVLQIYGFMPLILCFIGIIYLLNKGGRARYGLLLALVLLLVIMLAFARLQIGMGTIFERGVTTALLLIGILAGVGLSWIRTQLVSARFLNKYKPRVAAYSGDLLYALSVVVILAVAIPSRLNVPYYHMIDDEDYRAFVWIKDNIGPEYATALVDPWKATAFTAISGKMVPRRIWEKKEPVDDVIYNFLKLGCRNTTILRDNFVSFVYSEVECNNASLIEIRNNVFITNPNLSDSFITANLLQNAGFERFWGDPPASWSRYSQNCQPAFLFPQPGRDEGSCVAIRMSETKPVDPGAQATWGQRLFVQEGNSYYIEGWVKTENIIGQGGAMISAHWKGPGSKWIGASNFMKLIKGTNDWTYYQAKIIAPRGAIICDVALGLFGCSGKAWYDDIFFKDE